MEKIVETPDGGHVLYLFWRRYAVAMPRVSTIADLARGGLHLRIWCLRCARGRQIAAADVPPAFAALPFATAIARLRCGGCRAADAVLLVPASPPPSPEDAIVYDPAYTGARAIEEFFHTMRALRKKGLRAFPDSAPTAPPAMIRIGGLPIRSTIIGM